eukprot:m.343423 g.343423  ORF g.343423 m.343423 type:complete len:594 (+) comp19851_c1_seq6:377-2158(+)
MPRSEIQPAPEPMPETASTLPTTPDRQAVESVVAADGDDDDEDEDFFALLNKHHAKEEQAALEWSPKDEEEPHNPDHDAITGPQRWGLRFEYLLASPEGSQAFEDFLGTILCRENMQFWNDAAALHTCSEEEVRPTCQQLYEKYFAENCPARLNVNAPSREQVDKAFASDGTPGRHSFVKAQKEVYGLMKSDSYTKFLDSEIYQKCLAGTYVSKSAKTHADTQYSSKKTKKAKSGTPGRNKGGSSSNKSSPSQPAFFKRLFHTKKHRRKSLSDAESNQEQTAQPDDLKPSELPKLTAVLESGGAQGGEATASQPTSPERPRSGSFLRRLLTSPSRASTRSTSAGSGEKQASSHKRGILSPLRMNRKKSSPNDEAEDATTLSRSRPASVIVESPRRSRADKPRPTSLVEMPRQESGSGATLKPVLTDVPSLFRVALPNGHRTVVQAEQGQTVEQALSPVLDKFKVAAAVSILLQAITGRVIPWDTPSLAVEAQELALQPAEKLTVTFVDGSHSRIPVTPNQTVHQALEQSCRNRGLLLETLTPVLLDSENGTVLDWDLPAMNVAGKAVQLKPKLEQQPSIVLDTSADLGNASVA